MNTLILLFGAQINSQVLFYKKKNGIYGIFKICFVKPKQWDFLNIRTNLVLVKNFDVALQCWFIGRKLIHVVNRNLQCFKNAIEKEN